MFQEGGGGGGPLWGGGQKGGRLRKDINRCIIQKKKTKDVVRQKGRSAVRVMGLAVLLIGRKKTQQSGRRSLPLSGGTQQQKEKKRGGRRADQFFGVGVADGKCPCCSVQGTSGAAGRLEKDQEDGRKKQRKRDHCKKGNHSVLTKIKTRYHREKGKKPDGDWSANFWKEAMVEVTEKTQQRVGKK